MVAKQASKDSKDTLFKLPHVGQYRQVFKYQPGIFSKITEIIIIIFYIHIVCLFTIQQNENDKEELHKNEVLKYMI